MLRIPLPEYDRFALRIYKVNHPSVWSVYSVVFPFWQCFPWFSLSRILRISWLNPSVWSVSSVVSSFRGFFTRNSLTFP